MNVDFSKLKGQEIVDSGFNFLSSEFLNIKNWCISNIPNTYDSYFLKWDNSEILCPDDIFLHGSAKDLNNDLIYLKMSSIWGANSHCKRMKVGCLMVKDKSIISDGYNGSPSGFPNICESEDNVTLPYVLHAEANAITKLAKSTQSSVGSTLYVTLSPCYECSKLIIQSGIKRVVFSEVYRKPESIPFLVQGGIELVRINKYDQI